MAFILGCLLLGVVWAGASLAAFVTTRQALGASYPDALPALLRLPEYANDPGVAWMEPARSRLPGPVLYWACTGVAALCGALVGFATWRLWSGGTRTLERRTRLGVGAQARLARRADLAPLIVRRPEAGRFVFAQFRRHLLATEKRRPSSRWRRRSTDIGALCLTGPSRSGKTLTATRGIRRWQGPSILFSVKTDLLASTIESRSARGEVKIFDPTGITGEKSASWTPLRAAASLAGAQAAAKALIDASPRGEHEDSAYWLKQAEILLAGLLWTAANVEKTGMTEVVDWILAQDQPSEARSGVVAPLIRAIIDSDDERAPSARKVQTWLKGIWAMDPRTSSGIYGTARTAVWPWADPGVEAVSTTNEIDLDWLLEGENTLYVCAPLADGVRLSPVLGGLIGDLMNQAFERASRTRGALNPTLLVVLDEAANTPQRQLPEWASTLAGIGVQLVTIWQSKSQIDAIYGRQADTILTNHVTKVFFAGMSDGSGLDYVTRLLGQEHVPALLQPRAGLDVPPTQVPLAPANVLRQIKPGHALLVHGTLPPAHVRALRR